MCNYCDGTKKPLAERRDEIYHERIVVKYVKKAPLRSKDYWCIEAVTTDGKIYAPINYCPMCGRKLTEGK